MTRFYHLGVASLLAVLLIGCSTDDAPSREWLRQLWTRMKPTRSANFSRPDQLSHRRCGPYAFSATNGDLLVSSDETSVYITPTD